MHRTEQNKWSYLHDLCYMYVAMQFMGEHNIKPKDGVSTGMHQFGFFFYLKGHNTQSSSHMGQILSK